MEKRSNGMSQCVLVTALYNINRETVDGRKWASYLQWFQKTLRLNAKMVVFVEPTLESFVKENRAHCDALSTVIVKQTLESIPAYPYREKISRVLAFKSKQKGASIKVENTHAMYNVIMYSKFGWLQHAATLGLINGDKDDTVYLWIDAGISRFFPPSFDPANAAFPEESWIKAISNSGRVWMQSRGDQTKLDDAVNEIRDLAEEKYIGTNRCLIAGSLFGGTNKPLQTLCAYVIDFLDEILKRARMDNEQIALAVMAHRHPKLFTIVSPLPVTASKRAWTKLIGKNDTMWLPILACIDKPLKNQSACKIT